MAKKSAAAIEMTAESIGASGPWVSAKRGETWVDKKGVEHEIIGVVYEGFDSRANGVDERWRLWTHATRLEVKEDEDDVVVHYRELTPWDEIAAVSAWKRKGA
jgi:hypothetical protein